MTRAAVVQAFVVAGVLGGAATARAQAPALPVGGGSEVATARCLGCHGADLIVSQRLAQGGWDRELAKMERWGARVSADEKPGLVAFLTSRWGR